MKVAICVTHYTSDLPVRSWPVVIKRSVKAALPESLMRRIDRARLGGLRRRFGKLSRAEAFRAVYRERRWGEREEGEFCSGSGSRGALADAYCRLIEEYVRTHNISSIVDLGCGDFTIGRRLAALPLRSCGVDIVPEPIGRNRRLYGSERVTFQCLDILEDPLPDGDLCLVRQVLQHLSNAEIQALLPRLAPYRHVIVTEHVFSGVVEFPNSDKPHGPDTRLPDGSGVFLALPLFSCPVSSTWEFPCDEGSKMLALSLPTDRR